MAITDRTLISRKDLAERWGVSESHIDKLEYEGVIHRTKVGKCNYSLREIGKVEGLEEDKDYLAFRYKDLKEENMELKREMESLRRFKRTIKEMFYEL